MSRTPLAETIAELQRYIDTIGEQAACGALSVRKGELTLLLRCARRCEAIDSASHDKPIPWMLATGGMAYYASDIVPYFDAAAERDALAKRVGELEGDSASLLINKLTAESTRLRAENERLATRDGHLCDLVHAHEKALTAALGRVGELEALVRETADRMKEST